MLERNLLKWWHLDQTPSKGLLVPLGVKEHVKDIITINFLILELPRNANLIVDIRFNLYYYIYVHYYWRVGLSTIIKRILKLFKEK